MHIKYHTSQNILSEGLDRCKAKNIPKDILEDIESFISKINVDEHETIKQNKRLKSQHVCS